MAFHHPTSRLITLLTPLLFLSAPAHPQTLRDTERARTAAQDRQREATQQARTALQETQRLAPQRVAAAARLRGIETEVAARAAEVSALAERRDAAEAHLHESANALNQMLPLMERLALFPAETLLANPAPPEQTLRGLGILRFLAHSLEQRAAALRAEAAELATRQAALQAAIPALHQAEAEQAQQGQALDQQLAAAQATRQRAEQAGAEAAHQAAAEAARADSLRAALATLEAARQKAEAQAREDATRAERQKQDQAAAEARSRQEALARPTGPAPQPQGQLVTPVAGTILRAWGDQTDAGPATGVSYRPGPQARVVAPCPGRVRFAGPFRSYGALIILDCGGGYAFVLAGLGRLDVAAGTAVLAGEPIGIMPGWDAAGPAARPALYVELRRDGQAVNPAPFLRAQG